MANKSRGISMQGFRVFSRKIYRRTVQRFNRHTGRPNSTVTDKHHDGAARTSSSHKV